MSILDDLKATEDALRGIKAPRSEGAGHNFGKSKVNRLARGEDVSAKPETQGETE